MIGCAVWMKAGGALMTNPKPSAPAPLAVDAKTAARMLSIGVRKLWDLSAPRGPIPCAKVGTRVLYRVADLDTWLLAESRKAVRDESG